MRSGSRAGRRWPGPRWLGWGLAVAFLYLIVALGVSGHVPIRILYDGLAPIGPYRWVRAPSFLLGQSEPPTGGTGMVEITASGSEAVSHATDDGQAVLILPKNGITPHRGESVAEVKFSPLDPDTIAPPPPGRRFDGNAYRIEGVYQASRAPLVLAKAATVVLRYPSDASEIWWYSGSQWTLLQAGAGIVEASLQAYASADKLGIFVAAARAGQRSRSPAWTAYALAAVGLVVIATGVFLSRRRGAIRPRSGRRRRSRG